MPIPNSQLDRWTNHQTAAIQSAKSTHEHIRENIEDHDISVEGHDLDIETRLQGSYANETIIRASSDVDILVEMVNPFTFDVTKLTDSEERRLYRQYLGVRETNYDEYRAEILSILEDTYGASSVTNGDKAIKIDSTTLDLTADVVPCFEHRHYLQYTGRENPGDYIKGIAFYTSDGTKILNYPKRHKRRATSKHQSTNQRFKPTVRMMKNARNKMVEEGYLDTSDIAPSYFVECLMWNVEDRIIDTNNLQTRYLKSIENILNADLENYNHIHDLDNLFGPEENNWSFEDALMYLKGLVDLWENW